MIRDISFTLMATDMKTHFFTAFILLASCTAFAQPSYSSYDTIPSRYRGYHYTEWFDECPAYSNGGVLDSCHYEVYDVSANTGAPMAKYEFTDHQIKIRGLAAMVERESYINIPYIDSSMDEQYLYLLKRIDYYDTLQPNPNYVQHFRMKIIDSVRFDTVKPKLMVVSQPYPGLPNQYAYVYEAYFDKPVDVDSDFYIYGTGNAVYNFDTRVFLNWPFHYTTIKPQSHWLGCGEPYCDGECLPQGHYNTMGYLGYTNNSAIGYPQISDVWCESSFVYPDDPYGMYFAIVDHYELNLYSDSLPMGSVEGSGFYDENAVAECRAVPSPGFAFSHWNDGNTDNPRYLNLTQDTSFTAYFREERDFLVQLYSNNDEWGSVDGDGYYPANSTVTISATPADKYLFDRWDDGGWQNPRTFTLTQDTAFTAIFAPDPSQIGIDEGGLEQRLTMSPNPVSGLLTVSVGNGNIRTVEIIDLRGTTYKQDSFSGTTATLDISQLPTGTYIVRVSTNNGIAYKKLVVR